MTFITLWFISRLITKVSFVHINTDIIKINDIVYCLNNFVLFDRLTVAREYKFIIEIGWKHTGEGFDYCISRETWRKIRSIYLVEKVQFSYVPNKIRRSYSFTFFFKYDREMYEKWTYSLFSGYNESHGSRANVYMHSVI